MNPHGFPCPKCGSADIKRSHWKTWLEIPRSLVGIYRFRCLKCGDRFTGNIWRLATRGNAKCPRCLRLDIMPSVRKDVQMTRWQRLMMNMGAHTYRCVPCRLNFASFRKCIHHGVHSQADE